VSPRERDFPGVLHMVQELGKDVSPAPGAFMLCSGNIVPCFNCVGLFSEWHYS
jgi:hypothetical protein